VVDAQGSGHLHQGQASPVPEHPADSRIGQLGMARRIGGHDRLDYRDCDLRLGVVPFACHA
jgi:hypothetical protein